MKCPVCDHHEMVKKTLDETLSYGNQSLTLHEMRGEFCPSCGEGVWDVESYLRYIETQEAVVRSGRGDVSARACGRKGISGSNSVGFTK